MIRYVNKLKVENISEDKIFLKKFFKATGSYTTLKNSLSSLL